MERCGTLQVKTAAPGGFESYPGGCEEGTADLGSLAGSFALSVVSWVRVSDVLD